MKSQVHHCKRQSEKRGPSRYFARSRDFARLIMPVNSVQGATSVEVYGFTGWITTGVAYGRMQPVETYRMTVHSFDQCTLPG